MGLQAVTPSVNPVTLADVKAHLRIDGTADDATLTAYLAAALEFVESETRQQLCSRSYVYALDDFPTDDRFIKLPKPPLLSLINVQYRDVNGVTQVMDPSVYSADSISKPGRVVLLPGQAWPGTDKSANCVQVNFTAGYGSAANVPVILQQAIKLLVGHFYENREAATDRRIDSIPLAIDAIVQQHMYPEAVG